MTVRTYIYGTPHGFDLFEEGDTTFKELFKSFYISTRRGSRMVVTRKESGETIYSYLRYGMMENEGRPNSFFGMSLVLDDHVYTPDFAGMYDWFEFLFNKFLNRQEVLYASGDRGMLFHTNSEGVIQYAVDKFKNAIAEVDWLKSQLPNIFLSSADTPTENYSAGFSWVRNGQIALHNNEDDPSDILSDFRKYWTIALSPSFTKSVSLDYEEMVDYLNETNEKLLPIAVARDERSRSELKAIAAGFSGLFDNLSKYILQLKGKGDEEYMAFAELGEKYSNTKRQIATLVASYQSDVDSGPVTPTPPVTPKPEPRRTRYCVSCKRNKPLSEFASVDDNVCRECRLSRPVVPEPPVPPAPPVIYDWLFKPAVLAGAAVVLIAVISFFLLRGCEKGSDNGERDTSDTVAQAEGQRAHVDLVRLNELLEQNKFQDALKYLKSCDDGGYHTSTVERAVSDYLWEIIDSSKSPSEEIGKWFIGNRDVAMELSIDQDAWLKILEKYLAVSKLLQKQHLTQGEYDAAIGYISDFPQSLWSPRAERLAQLRKLGIEHEQSSVAVKPTPASEGAGASAASVTVSLTRNGKPLVITKDKSGFGGKAGDTFVIASNQTISITGAKEKFQISADGSKVVTVEMKDPGSIIARSGNMEITLTCEVKKPSLIK